MIYCIPEDVIRGNVRLSDERAEVDTVYCIAQAVTHMRTALESLVDFDSIEELDEPPEVLRLIVITKAKELAYRQYWRDASPGKEVEQYAEDYNAQIKRLRDDLRAGYLSSRLDKRSKEGVRKLAKVSFI